MGIHLLFVCELTLPDITRFVAVELVVFDKPDDGWYGTTASFAVRQEWCWVERIFSFYTQVCEVRQCALVSAASHSDNNNNDHSCPYNFHDPIKYYQIIRYTAFYGVVDKYTMAHDLHWSPSLLCFVKTALLLIYFFRKDKTFTYGQTCTRTKIEDVLPREFYSTPATIANSSMLPTSLFNHSKKNLKYVTSHLFRAIKKPRCS